MTDSTRRCDSSRLCWSEPVESVWPVTSISVLSYSFSTIATEFSVCRIGGSDSLLEGLEGDDLEELGLDHGDVCGGQFADAGSLEAFLNDSGSGLDIGLDLELSADGAELGQWAGSGSANQEWSVADSGGGTGGIVVDGNDIWGWADPETGSEYALVGMENGLAFVDITTPTADGIARYMRTMADELRFEQGGRLVRMVFRAAG